LVTRFRSHGVTLVEILVVVAILGVVAVAAIPDLRSSDPHRLDLAAEEFAGAMRFARSEAMRTGEPRGFRQQIHTTWIRVFRPDTSTSPWNPIYDVYHPISRQLYDIELNTHPFAAVDSLTQNPVYRGTCDKPDSVYFDSTGAPRCLNPRTVLLEQFDVTLTLGPHTRIVTLDGITGRVRVQ
jgi:type II secretion system protein H